MDFETTKMVVGALRDAREFYASNGWDTSRVTVGHYEGVVRICDDNGAADLRLVHHGIAAFYCGDSAMVVVHIVQLALQTIRKPVQL